MDDSYGDAVRRLEKAQKVIEYSLAVVVPGLIALMLYSYMLFDEAFQMLFAAAMVAAALMLVPAYQALRLHYQCWSKNLMPQRMVTGFVGMIYISAASAFGVSLVSASRGLDPEQPLTFAVFGSLAVSLIAIMAYSSKNKDRFEHMDIRFYRRPHEETLSDIKGFLDAWPEQYMAEKASRRSTLTLARTKVTIAVTAQAGESSEVIIECLEPAGTDVCEGLKKHLDRRA